MSTGSITIVGVDCATQPQNTGLALGRLTGGKLVLAEVRRATKKESADEIARQWIRNSDRVQLALDAPLGWPAPLGKALTPMPSCRRMTDQNIEDRLGKRPFEVGADLIARTAFCQLGGIPDQLTKPMPLCV